MSQQQNIQKSEYWLRLCLALQHTIKGLLIDILHNTHKDTSYQGLPTDPQQLFNHLISLKNNGAIPNRVLFNDQWNIILPTCGTSNPQDFDITILCVLIRNCLSISPKDGWNKPPLVTDQSKAAYCMLARNACNKILHHGNVMLTENEFNILFFELQNIAF